ncbi:sodium-dependent lysophosphatidylcholine symporter 1 [Osmerus mordax]|uniref:sodium-dependent lysophosphatidylcholine symporter 1 n=1 Tax=Osmerus mordax TaxID=8014 RepID=UPI00350F1D53
MMAENDVVEDCPLNEKYPISTENEDAKTKRQAGIPLSRKLCYAVGGVPYQMTLNAKGLFMQIFLLDVVQMGAFYASIILFLGRAWDALTDPLVGYLVSRSGRTRFGKLIPWIIFSMPLGVLSYVMLWFTPQEVTSPGFSFSWFFTWNCLFDLFMSCSHVPFSSLNMFLGGDQRDRDSATSYRMGMEVFATLAVALIQGQIVGVYHARKVLACSQINSSDTLLLQNASDTLTDTLQNTRRAYVLAALVLAGFYFLCVLILFLGVKEQLAPLSTLGRVRMSYLSGMRLVVGHTPYVQLVAGFLFSSIAFQMAQGSFALFCTHVAGVGQYFQHIILVLLASATVSVPLWQAVLLRLGKKTTLFIGLSIYGPAIGVFASVNNNLPVFFIMAVFAGGSLAVLYLLPWSMLPDVVDDFKVQNPTSTGLEPLFFSCFVFFNKFGGGLAVGISTLVLHYAGYQSGACRQPSEVIMSLRVLFSPVPIVLLLVGLGLFYCYPVNEERRSRNQRALLAAVGKDGGSGEAR